GVAIIGSVFASLTVSRTVDALRDARLPSRLRDTAVAGVHTQGASVPGPRGTPDSGAGTLTHPLATRITGPMPPPLLAAAAFVSPGACLSRLLPRVRPVTGEPEPLVEALVALEPVEPDPALLLDRER